MTDGNMAGQVSPTASPIISEGEVNMFRDFMNRLANTVVQASDFAAHVQSLTQELNMLRADCENVRKRNAELDEALAQVREARDKAQAEVSRYSADLSKAHGALDDAEYKLGNQAASINILQSEVDKLRKERDEAQFNALVLTEARDKAEETLAKFRGLLGITAPATPQAPAPNPAAIEPAGALEDPAPATSPAPADAKPDPVRDDWWAEKQYGRGPQF